MHTHIAEWVKFVLFLVPPGGLLFIVGLTECICIYRRICVFVGAGGLALISGCKYTWGKL